MGSSDERKSHKHKHSKHSKSKHKKHRHHHHKHHHKKSHKKDKPRDQEAGVDLSEHLLQRTLETLETKNVVDSNTLELVMTEHLLSQLEGAEDESDDSDESSVDEEGDSSNRTKSENNPFSSSQPSSSKDGGGSKPEEKVVNDPQVSSTSSNSSKSTGKSLKINIQSNSLPTVIDLTADESTEDSGNTQTSKSSENVSENESRSVAAGSGDAMVMYVNLKPMSVEGSAGKDADEAKSETVASKKTDSQNEAKRDGGSKEKKRQHRRSKSRSTSRHRDEPTKKRRRSRSQSRSRRSHSRNKRSRSRSKDRRPGYRGRRSRSRGRRSRSRNRGSVSKNRSRSRNRRSHSRDRRSRSRDRRSSYRRRRSSSRSPRRSYSRQKSRSPRRGYGRRRSYSRGSKSRSPSKSKSRSRSREAEEASARFSKLQVVQSVSKIAKEFGSIKKQVEIGKLTNLCVQLQEQQAEENGSEGMGVARTRKEVRAPFVVNPVHPALVFENNAWKTSNQVVLEVNAALARRPVEEVFPVSAGVEHAGVQESAVRVDNVFEQMKSLPVGDLVAKRLEATQRLQMNPADVNARLTLNMIDQQTALWAHSNTKPGQYTGRQTLSALSVDDHKAGFQTWAKKHMFHGLLPVVGGFGLKMLKKMGWKEGQPLGLQGRGHVEPLAIDVKTDRSGLKSSADKGGYSRASTPAPKAKVTASTIAQSKHPVSALQEICQKRHWNVPQYQLTPSSDGYPFLCKVVLPTGSYVPLSGSCTKKEARANAAAAALHGLGLTAKTIEYSYSAL